MMLALSTVSLEYILPALQARLGGRGKKWSQSQISRLQSPTKATIPKTVSLCLERIPFLSSEAWPLVIVGDCFSLFISTVQQLGRFDYY